MQRVEQLLRQCDEMARWTASGYWMPTDDVVGLQRCAREDVKARLSLPLPRPVAKPYWGCTCARCKPALYQSLREGHPKDEDLSVRTTGIWPGCHPAWSLAIRAVRSFDSRRPDRQTLRWGRLRAIADWKTWWQDGQSSAAKHLRSLDLRHAVPRPQHFFGKVVEIFSQLFFLGALSSRSVKIIWGLDESSLHGITSGMTIVLNPQRHSHRLAPPAVLCTILHEMLHIFLCLYSCRGGVASCGNEVCEYLRVDNLGIGGHGRAWQYMAQKIEAEMPRLLGFGGRLGRQECALKEIVTLGFRPSSCDIQSLYSGFDVQVQIHLRTSFDDLDVIRPRLSRRSIIGSSKRKRRRTVGICERLVVM